MAATNNFDRPALACEIGVERVIAARANGQSLETYATRRLPTGAVNPSWGHVNVANPDALREAISGALSSVAGKGRDVVAILPDAAVRVLLVDFDSLPEAEEEASAIIRFRVKKSLPFDVDHAALSYHAQRSNGAVKVIAALSPRSIIDEYEAAFRDAGYEPGVVMPSILATLGIADADRPAMVVKVDPNTTTVAIVDRNELLLLRTLDHPGRTDMSAAELTQHVHPSIVFYEDTFSSKIENLFVTGMSNLSGLATGLSSETGIRAEELAANAAGDSLGDQLPRTMLAPVAGALVGA
jgi:type IV pilus assembly protein PilM